MGCPAAPEGCPDSLLSGWGGCEFADGAVRDPSSRPGGPESCCAQNLGTLGGSLCEEGSANGNGSGPPGRGWPHGSCHVEGDLSRVGEEKGCARAASLQNGSQFVSKRIGAPV